MAGASLLALLDDIASILDDVSVLTKAATKKTAGVLGDDLALNAQQVAGVKANRELPVVWAVAKGSLVNKAILVPAALLISAIAPWAIVPLLMAGGLFLCYEGFEKIWHALVHRGEVDEHRKELHEAIVDPTIDLRRRRARQDQGCRAHRLHPFRGNHRHHARHRGHGRVRRPRRGARGHRPADDRGRVRPRRGHREARRRRPLPQSADRRRRDPAPAPCHGPRCRCLRAVADEAAVRPRHRRDVPGRRRHPGARHPVARALDQVGRGTPDGLCRNGARAGRNDTDPGQPGRRYRRRCMSPWRWSTLAQEGPASEPLGNVRCPADLPGPPPLHGARR